MVRAFCIGPRRFATRCVKSACQQRLGGRISVLRREEDEVRSDGQPAADRRTTVLVPEAVMPHQADHRARWGLWAALLLAGMVAGIALAWSVGLMRSGADEAVTAPPIAAPLPPPIAPRSPYPSDLPDLSGRSAATPIPDLARGRSSADRRGSSAADRAGTSDRAGTVDPDCVAARGSYVAARAGPGKARCDPTARAKSGRASAAGPPVCGDAATSRHATAPPCRRGGRTIVDRTAPGPVRSERLSPRLAPCRGTGRCHRAPDDLARGSGHALRGAGVECLRQP